MKENTLQLIPQKYKGSYAKKLDSLQEMNTFLKTYNIPKNCEEIEIDLL
jgi:hypothetical protein